MRYLFLLPLLFGMLPAPAQDTFSIVAVDSTTGEVGSAGASCIDLFRFPFITPDQIGEVYPGRGAINTQSYYLEQNQRNAATRLLAGDTPREVIRWLAANDVEGRPGDRQYGVAALQDGRPAAAAYTGATSANYRGQLVGANYAIQGNILLGPEVLEDMEARFLSTEGDLACKLMAALQGAKRVGADVRCARFGTSSLFAYLKVARFGDAFGAPSLQVTVQLREEARLEPIDSLQRLFDTARAVAPRLLLIRGRTHSKSRYTQILPAAACCT